MRWNAPLPRAVLALVAACAPLAAQSTDPIAVALMTGFSPGANPGMAMLNTKLQAEFGAGPAAFSSQVFAYTDQSGAATFLAAAPANARHVLVGHSWGASSNFTLAQNVLGPMGIDVELQVSVEWVSQSNPFQATTPTVPPQILLAYNYHQTSTTLFEPVPSHTIIGAARNLNLEVVFADSSFVHTSIDDDARTHALVIERVRELIVAPPWAGTNEHLDLFARKDTLAVACNPGSGITTAGVLSQRAVQTVQAGQWVTLRTISPEGDFASAWFGILGDIFVTGFPPVPALPGVASGLNPASVVLFTPGAIQTPPFFLAPLPASGVNISFCWPAGIPGISVLLQTAVIAPNAQNGLYATSFGIELQGL